MKRSEKPGSPDPATRASTGLLFLAGAILWLLGSGCQAVVNTTMESVFGYEKRELLKKSVNSLREDQQEAQGEFKDAMTRLKDLYGFEGGKLEAAYEKLKGSYEDCESQAEVVRKRIENMEDIADSMFEEWEKEIKQFSNPAFAADSRRQLKATRERYAQLSKSVHAAERSMVPVLTQLRDHVVYLKHNLNAAAIGSLKGESASIQKQVEDLMGRMNASVAEADAFIQSLSR